MCGRDWSSCRIFILIYVYLFSCYSLSIFICSNLVSLPDLPTSLMIYLYLFEYLPTSFCSKISQPLWRKRETDLFVENLERWDLAKTTAAWLWSVGSRAVEKSWCRFVWSCRFQWWKTHGWDSKRLVVGIRVLTSDTQTDETTNSIKHSEVCMVTNLPGFKIVTMKSPYQQDWYGQWSWSQ